MEMWRAHVIKFTDGILRTTQQSDIETPQSTRSTVAWANSSFRVWQSCCYCGKKSTRSKLILENWKLVSRESNRSHLKRQKRNKSTNLWCKITLISAVKIICNHWLILHSNLLHDTKHKFCYFVRVVFFFFSCVWDMQRDAHRHEVASVSLIAWTL